MKDELAKIVSIITIAPVMAFLMLTFLYIFDKDVFREPVYYVIAVLSLTVFPVLAYPFQIMFPKLRKTGRDGQRKLAFIFAVIGYLAGLAVSYLLNAPRDDMMIMVSYAISGSILALFNLCHIKASGHACGVGGPCVLCAYFLGGCGWLILLLIPLIFWARLHMKRHRFPELIIGASISMISACIVINVM